MSTEAVGALKDISIHALREESDMVLLLYVLMRLSISIHALREESDLRVSSSVNSFVRISIHALREESDTKSISNHCYNMLDFNPRSPRGERPKSQSDKPIEVVISIHALREESDYRWHQVYTQRNYFNPRSPRGERQTKTTMYYLRQEFQSTLSARRATTLKEDKRIQQGISIHALREESDFAQVIIKISMS